MPIGPPSRRERASGAATALAVTGLFGWALVTGLGFDPVRRVSESLQTFIVAPETPPPSPDPVIPPPKRDPRPEGEAAPPNLRSKATQATAPKPIVVLPLPPPPIVVAEKPGPGVQATSGAADVPGPGTGAGGVGNGFGSGGSGDGDGGGWADETPPEQIGGDLRDSDFPRDLDRRGMSGTVGVAYVVLTNGRVGDCEIRKSSGSSEADALTCRLIQKRFRFRPSLDARGRPVPSTVIENHSWDFEYVPDDR